MRTNQRALSTLALVRQALEGDQAAWNKLFRLMTPCLKRAIRRCLTQREQQDVNLVEEVCQQVWCQLLDAPVGRGKLRAFDPEQWPCLEAYLACLARTQLRIVWRAQARERRRMPRAAPAQLWRVPARQSDQGEFEGDLLALNQCLPPALQNRLRERLQPPAGCSAEEGAAGPSEAQWQQDHRLRDEIHQYCQKL
jgi:hypothetical protein